jgi:hypothetical protein
MTIPVDIKKRIEKLFISPADRQKVERLLLSLWTTQLNVGEEQLARSILVLSDGLVSKVSGIFKSDFLGDPRDVIMAAEKKAGNPGHYFIDPFFDTDIVEPPNELDGAKVIKWARSGHKPFGFIGNANDPQRQIIYGLAICSYGKNEGVYRFSCDRNWEVITDGFYDTEEQAMEQSLGQYNSVEVNWQTR